MNTYPYHVRICDTPTVNARILAAVRFLLVEAPEFTLLELAENVSASVTFRSLAVR